MGGMLGQENLQMGRQPRCSHIIEVHSPGFDRRAHGLRQVLAECEDTG
jgi:hypothetical protein